jgi:ring-1,2-phenylacetyl-CoA epoxidase subunit PaaC
MNTSNSKLFLADTLMILAQRLSELCGHGPILEEDIALSNIALDYLGQATLLYNHVGGIEGKQEDHYPFLRNEKDFQNLLIVELPNGEYSFTIIRQFFFSSWYLLYLTELQKSSDEFLRGFSEKAIKEVRYHLQHSKDWVIRLGDGTKLSHEKMQDALEEITPYLGEFFCNSSHEMEDIQSCVLVDNELLKMPWLGMVNDVLDEAKLELPHMNWYQSGGKEGNHTENLGYILAEMQSLPRAYPNATW